MTSEPERISPISRHGGGSAIAIHVTPRASRSTLEESTDGLLRVRIAAPPVDGAANVVLLRFLADVLHVPRSQLKIVSGKSSRRKVVMVDGLTPDALQSCLDHALGKK